MDRSSSPRDRLARRRAQLAGGTLAQWLAWASDPDQESGRWGALGQRLRLVAALPDTSVLLHEPLLSLAQLAVDLRTDPATGGGPFGLRWVAQAITDGRRLEAAAEHEVWFAEPDPTGDVRWDAMLGGIAEREARRMARPVPGWAGRPDRVLGTWWWLSPVASLRAYTFTHTPPELSVRGVFVSEDSLESV